MAERRISTTSATALTLANLLFVGVASGAGTPAGTVISGAAEVSFELDGTPTSETSNVTSITVVERIDVVAALQSAQLLVSAGDVDQSLLFTVSNTGNGNETVLLSIDSNLTGDDFDPEPAVPAFYFDSDASGSFSVGDTAYSPGTNDPVLAADESIDVMLVNDIPAAALNGQLGRSQLMAIAATGSGNPGDDLAGQGDGGLDAVIGSTGGTASVIGEYLVSDVSMAIVKSVVVSDPFGGQDAIPDATLTYTITIEVTNDGTATAASFRDPVPTGTTYVPNSILFNTGAITDAVDGDVGELDSTAAPTVVVRLGDLAQADGVQTVEFQVTID
jgi:uncharacterized repeat protein (TIGR01451 family)